jgi:UDP-N-acetylmuramyl pentapeptide phosphotransferase/UDP-N-acetylglucosamine-1-phosphate transferase
LGTAGGNSPIGAHILKAVAPLFIIGLFEDLTGKIGVKARLLSIVCSSFILIWITGDSLRSSSIPFIGYALSEYALVSICFTAFALTGLTNSFNIIDGLNGLSGVSALLALSALGLVAADVGAEGIQNYSMVMVAALTGFLILNFPYGKIFLGDSGAYFLGFAVGALAVNLVTETLFSIFRRWVTGRGKATAPDSKHIHHLIYEQLLIKGFSKTICNSLASALLWPFNILSAALGVAYYDDSSILRMLCLLFLCGYLGVYFYLNRRTGV